MMRKDLQRNGEREWVECWVNKDWTGGHSLSYGAIGMISSGIEQGRVAQA